MPDSWDTLDACLHSIPAPRQYCTACRFMMTDCMCGKGSTNSSKNTKWVYIRDAAVWLPTPTTTSPGWLQLKLQNTEIFWQTVEMPETAFGKKYCKPALRKSPCVTNSDYDWVNYLCTSVCPAYRHMLLHVHCGVQLRYNALRFVSRFNVVHASYAYEFSIKVQYDLPRVWHAFSINCWTVGAKTRDVLGMSTRLVGRDRKKIKSKKNI